MIKGCILPWMHLYGDVRGRYNLCCHISGSLDDMGDYQEPISSIFNNEKYKKIRTQMLSGNIPEMCKKACYDIEDLGG